MERNPTSKRPQPGAHSAPPSPAPTLLSPAGGEGNKEGEAKRGEKKGGGESKRESIIADVLSRYPGMYSARLGIALDNRDPTELFKWFLASILYGARISGEIAERTYSAFIAGGIDSPGRVVDTGWDGLVKVLDEGGYTRYDFKTADKLLEVCGRLISEYGGDLNKLHDEASGPEDLQARLIALGKGIGEITVNIFLRELRGVWPKASPGLSPLAIKAARSLGLIKRGKGPLASLTDTWGKGIPGNDFRDLEAALVQMGIELRRKRAA